MEGTPAGCNGAKTTGRQGRRAGRRATAGTNSDAVQATCVGDLVDDGQALPAHEGLCSGVEARWIEHQLHVAVLDGADGFASVIEVVRTERVVVADDLPLPQFHEEWVGFENVGVVGALKAPG